MSCLLTTRLRSHPPLRWSWMGMSGTCPQRPPKPSGSYRKLNRKRRESMAQGTAVRKAKDTLDRVGSKVPVDVEAAAKACGVRVVHQDLEDSVSGMLVIKDGHGVIGVNQNHHPNRRRFTIGHELGHYILHRRKAKVFVDASPVFFRDETSADGTETQEVDANAFAAELLMPENV